MGFGDYLLVLSFFSGVFFGIKHYIYLSENRPNKEQIYRINMKFLGWGIVSFVLMFLPYVGLIASIPFGLFFGLMLLNMSYEKTL
jgi:hypothetical protein